MLLLEGDFNCPGIDWRTCNLTESYLPGLFRESLIEFAQDFLLEQIVLEPTRGDNILDLCFTSHPGIIHQCRTVPGFSDHHAALVEISCNPSTTKKQVYCYNSRIGLFSWGSKWAFKKYYELNEQGQISVADNWNYIRDNLSKVINTYVPVKFCSNRKLGWLFN